MFLYYTCTIFFTEAIYIIKINYDIWRNVYVVCNIIKFTV